MSSTSTNKQPLLGDRPLLVVARLDATSMPSASVDPGTGTNGVMLVDCTSNDGAVITAVHLVQRVAGNSTPVNLFLSSSATALGAGTSGVAEAQFLAQAAFGAGPDPGGIVEFLLPKILAPVPHAGENLPSRLSGTPVNEPPQFRALWLPRGKALWASVASTSTVPNAPNIVVQGLYY